MKRQLVQILFAYCHRRGIHILQLLILMIGLHISYCTSRHFLSMLHASWNAIENVRNSPLTGMEAILTRHGEYKATFFCSFSLPLLHLSDIDVQLVLHFREFFKTFAATFIDFQHIDELFIKMVGWTGLNGLREIRCGTEKSCGLCPSS